MDMKGDALFVRDPLLDRALRLGLPLLMYPLYVLVLVLAFPDVAPIYLALVTAYVVPPVGGETLIPIATAFGYPWWLTAASFAWVDIAGCLLVALNADLLFALPYIGPSLSRTAGTARAFFERHPALRRLSYPGLVLFTVLPFAGSGGIGGALAGRVLGLGRGAVVVCVSAGSVIGSALIAFGAGAAADLLREYCAAGTVVVALVLACTAIFLLCRVALLHMGGPPISRDR
jgi:uncharacterized membrane protein